MSEQRVVRTLKNWELLMASHANLLAALRHAERRLNEIPHPHEGTNFGQLLSAREEAEALRVKLHSP